MSRPAFELLNLFANGNETLHYDDMSKLISLKLITINEASGQYEVTPVGKQVMTGGVIADVVTTTPRLAEKLNPLDAQVDGGHYKKLGMYQPWLVAAATMTPEELRGYMKGTVLAYIMREGDKGGDTDIEKACHTIQLWQEVRKDK